MRKLAKITALLLFTPVLACGCGKKEPEPEPVEVAPEIIHISREPDTAEILAAVEAWHPAVTNSIIHATGTQVPSEENITAEEINEATKGMDDATADIMGQILCANLNIATLDDGSFKYEAWQGAWGVYGGDCVMLENGDLVFYKDRETYYRLGGDGWIIVEFPVRR